MLQCLRLITGHFQHLYQSVQPWWGVLTEQKEWFKLMVYISKQTGSTGSLPPPPCQPVSASPPPTPHLRLLPLTTTLLPPDNPLLNPPPIWGRQGEVSSLKPWYDPVPSKVILLCSDTLYGQSNNTDCIDLVALHDLPRFGGHFTAFRAVRPVDRRIDRRSVIEVMWQYTPQLLSEDTEDARTCTVFHDRSADRSNQPFAAPTNWQLFRAFAALLLSWQSYQASGCSCQQMRCSVAVHIKRGHMMSKIDDFPRINAALEIYIRPLGDKTSVGTRYRRKCHLRTLEA